MLKRSFVRLPLNMSGRTLPWRQRLCLTHLDTAGSARPDLWRAGGVTRRSTRPSGGATCPSTRPFPGESVQRMVPIMSGLALMVLAAVFQAQGLIVYALSILGPLCLVVGVAAIVRPDAFGRDKVGLEWRQPRFYRSPGRLVCAAGRWILPVPEQQMRADLWAFYGHDLTPRAADVSAEVAAA